MFHELELPLAPLGRALALWPIAYANRASHFAAIADPGCGREEGVGVRSVPTRIDREYFVP
jgi:hypothetical protein